MHAPPVSTVRTWEVFQQRWDGVHNFLVADACVPFAYAVPPLERVVAELRDHAEVRITPGTRGDRLNLADTAAAFRALPVGRALETSFALAHFHLEPFDAPGRCLHGFFRQVMEPWQQALAAAGFTFERCYPIVFISGRHCATNYHMDFSHVLAWQVHGRKSFCSLRDPDRWAPREVRVNHRAGELTRPAELTAADVLCHDLQPGDVLWNALLTPHWVEAGEDVAMSINLSHRGVRYQGQLCRHEQELAAHRQAQAGPKR
jgi:hypothetical protein